MLTSDERLIDQYRKLQTIKKANAKFEHSRFYQKIKEDMKNNIMAPFKYEIKSDDQLSDIDIAARYFNIDYDIIHKPYYYAVIYDPYHEYQPKRYQQIQKFINYDLCEKEDWLRTIPVGGIICTFAFLMIGIILICDHPLISIFLLTIDGLVFIGLCIDWCRIYIKIKQMTANLPTKASDIKL